MVLLFDYGLTFSYYRIFRSYSGLDENPDFFLPMEEFWLKRRLTRVGEEKVSSGAAA